MRTVLIVVLFCVAASAAELTQSQLSLSEAIEQARDRNPEIVAARKNWQMADARILAEKTLPPPEVGVEYWGVPRESVSVGQAPEKWIDLSQTLPFPGKLWLRGRAAAHGARREEAVYRTTELNIVSQVKEAYYELLLAQRSVKLYDDTSDILRRFARIAESKYAVGRTSQPSVLKAQVELSKTQNRALTARQELETARAKLNALLDRKPDESVGTVEEPVTADVEPALDELERTALSNNPDVHTAAHHVAHMSAELAAARADYLPDFMAQYSWRTREGLPPDSIAMLKMTLPFVWFWRQNSIVKSTRLGKEHADAMLEAAKTQAAYEVKARLTEVQTAQRLVELYKTTILPQTEQSLRVSESAYQADRLGFLDLLDAERVYVDSMFEYYKAISDYGVALAKLDRVLGTDEMVAGREGHDEHQHE